MTLVVFHNAMQPEQILSTQHACSLLNTNIFYWNKDRTQRQKVRKRPSKCVRNFSYFCLCVARTVFQLLTKFVLQEHFVESLAQEEVPVDDRSAASDQVLNVCNTSPIMWKTHIKCLLNTVGIQDTIIYSK